MKMRADSFTSRVVAAQRGLPGPGFASMFRPEWLDSWSPLGPARRDAGRADLRRAVLVGADLGSADLRGADMRMPTRAAC